MAKTKHGPAAGKKTKEGHVSQVIGAVVDVQFPAGEQPELFEALEVTTQDGRVVVLEVEGDLGSCWRRDAGAHVQRDRNPDRRRARA